MTAAKCQVVATRVNFADCWDKAVHQDSWRRQVYDSDNTWQSQHSICTHSGESSRRQGWVGNVRTKSSTLQLLGHWQHLQSLYQPAIKRSPLPPVKRINKDPGSFKRCEEHNPTLKKQLPECLPQWNRTRVGMKRRQSVWKERGEKKWRRLIEEWNPILLEKQEVFHTMISNEDSPLWQWAHKRLKIKCVMFIHNRTISCYSSNEDTPLLLP